MQEIRIGQNIAALRKNSRITQEQLAQALHISSQAVSKWECGICLPDTVTVPQIAEYFHVSIDFLYYGKAETMHNSEKEAVNREKNYYANRLLYRTFKEEELDALTDDEFAHLQEKLDNYLTFSPGYNVNFIDFYHGTNAEDIRGNGNDTDFRIYRRKAMADENHRSLTFYCYERLFSLAYALGVRHFYDIGCGNELQAFLLTWDKDLHYTGIDTDIFHAYYDDFHTEPSYVNGLFEKFTASDRIKYIKAEYPCELDVRENNIAIASHVFGRVTEQSPLFPAMSRDFERIILDLNNQCLNPALREMSAKDAVQNDIRVWIDPFEEDYVLLKKIMPEFEFFQLGTSGTTSTYVFGTKIPSDLEKLEKRYIRVGDRLLSGVVDRYLCTEMTK